MRCNAADACRKLGDFNLAIRKYLEAVEVCWQSRPTSAPTTSSFFLLFPSRLPPPLSFAPASSSFLRAYLLLFPSRLPPPLSFAPASSSFLCACLLLFPSRLPPPLSFAPTSSSFFLAYPHLLLLPRLPAPPSSSSRLPAPPRSFSSSFSFTSHIIKPKLILYIIAPEPISYTLICLSSIDLSPIHLSVSLFLFTDIEVGWW